MNIKILQWNVWRKERAENIVKEVKKIKPDIFCVQELIQDSRKNIDTAKYIAKQLRLNYFYKQAETWSNREELEAQGNAIFTEFPIIKKTFSYLQKPLHNPPDAMHEGRVYLEVRCKINKQILSVATTHLSFTPFFKITAQRKKEINNLTKILSDKKRNFIFAADLNSAPDSYTVVQISKYLQHAGPVFSQKTWTTKAFDYHHLFREDKLNWRLDYVFTSQDVKVTDAKILKTKYSDHLPVFVKINI